VARVVTMGGAGVLLCPDVTGTDHLSLVAAIRDSRFLHAGYLGAELVSLADSDSDSGCLPGAASRIHNLLSGCVRRCCHNCHLKLPPLCCTTHSPAAAALESGIWMVTGNWQMGTGKWELGTRHSVLI